jgi:TATA-box binding protein (TBP) (component of TFIID and TFIIIB)
MTDAIARDVIQPNTSGRVYYTVPLQKLNYYMRQFGTQLNVRRFAATILRNDELSSATLIFDTIKLVDTGCARPELALITLQDALDKIRLTGYDQFEVPVPKLRNIVSNGCFPRQICTYMMVVMYGNCCKRVARFPTVIIRTEKMKRRVILLFDSGQMCHSGATTLAEIHDDFEEVYPMVLSCIRTRQTSKTNLECMRLIELDTTQSTDHTRQNIEEMRAKLLSTTKTKRSNDAANKPQLTLHKK